MASTYSTSLKLELMATGDQSGTWGDTTNTNLGTLLEQAITGFLSVAQGDVANLTLTSLDGAADQARNAVIDLTGAMTANRNVVVPTSEKVYLFKNSTTGGFVVTVKTVAGTGVTIPNGTARWVYCDGTNVVDALSGPWTPSANDGQALGASGTAWADLFLASGAVINWNAGDVTLTHAANTLAFAGASSGYTFDAAVTPSANDAAALGSATVSWADLFLASGAVVNVANGNWVMTHTSGIMTVGTGDLRVTTAGTNSASVATVGGTQTLTAKTLTSPTITTSPTAAGATWTDLGSVTTVDINGGTADGVVIGGASAAAGTFTTATANVFVPNNSAVPTNGLYLPAANTLGWAINSAAEMQLTATALSPAADGGSSLGTTALGWQNLFGNTGFVLNLENSDWVATHTAGILTVGTGDLRVTTAGTNTASAVTVGGTQTLTSKTMTSPVLNTPTVGTTITPTSNDGAALGTTSLMWSDLFLADGGVINWNNSAITMTQSAGGVTMTYSDAGASSGPNWILDRASASPAANDALGYVEFKGRDSGANSTTYTRIFTGIIDPTNGSEDGFFGIETMLAGSQAGRAWFAGGLSMLSVATDPGAGLVYANGYAFPATQVDSAGVNTLDDYEEGTFTPTLLFGGANTGMTFTSRAGAYTKIGHLVTFTVSFVLSAKGSNGGAATIGALPFTASSTGLGACAIGSYAAMSGVGVFMAQVGNSVATVTLNTGAATTSAALTDANFTDTSAVTLSGYYRV